MARWDRILYNGRQYVPAEDYDRMCGALRNAEEVLWSIEASDWGDGGKDAITAIQLTAKDAGNDARRVLQSPPHAEVA